MFFRKEREFYAKYSPYERGLDRLFKWFELKKRAELPSDIDTCDVNIRNAVSRLHRQYGIHQYLVKWKEKAGW